jgi:chromosome segregation ATPase
MVNASTSEYVTTIEGGLVAIDAGASADPCAAVLLEVQNDLTVYAATERQADLEAQELAAKKADAAAVVTLLNQIQPATTAWDTAKPGLMAAVAVLWADLAPCRPTLDAALGDDKDCMQQAYDGYGQQLATLQDDLTAKNAAAADAAQSSAAAAAELAQAQNLLAQRYAQFAAYMGTRRDDLNAATQNFKAAMGTRPCDARQAYILLREAQDIYNDFTAQADKCLPEEMRNLIQEINDLQDKNRKAQTAVQQANDAVTHASSAITVAQANPTEVITELFDQCKSAGVAAPHPHPAAGPAGTPRMAGS